MILRCVCCHVLRSDVYFISLLVKVTECSRFLYLSRYHNDSRRQKRVAAFWQQVTRACWLSDKICMRRFWRKEADFMHQIARSTSSCFFRAHKKHNRNFSLCRFCVCLYRIMLNWNVKEKRAEWPSTISQSVSLFLLWEIYGPANWKYNCIFLACQVMMHFIAFARSRSSRKLRRFHLKKRIIQKNRSFLI